MTPNETPTDSARDGHPLTAEQAVRVRKFSDLSFAPNGEKLAFTVLGPSGEGAPESHVWMLDTVSKKVWQFTQSGHIESSPRWSPSGESLGFISDRSGRNQVYLIPALGGEASALTRGSSAVSSFRWSPDGSRIAFLAPQDKGTTQEADPRVADSEQDLDRLWIIDVQSKETRQVTTGPWRIQQIDWESESSIIVVATDRPRDESWDYAVYRVATASGGFDLLARPNPPFGGITVSPVRTNVAFVASAAEGPIPHNMFVLSLSGGDSRDLTSSIDRPINKIIWQDAQTIVVSVTTGFNILLYRVSLNGELNVVDLPCSIGDFDVSSHGAIAYVASGFNSLPEIYLKKRDGLVERVTHLHSDWPRGALANAEVFKFDSFDGTQIEAALMSPSTSVPKVGFPLILYVHGGPASNFTSSYYSWPQLLTAYGYQVLMVNPRGSTGYGEEFLKANRGDWGGGDFRDLMAAVDCVLVRGSTNPQSLGIAGWSYGGYMAEWAITQTTRFGAAVSGAGMFDLAAEFETEIEPADDEWYFGTPWEHPDRFAKDSPYLYVKQARTPTLILQGELDVIDPVGQSTGLYRALKRYGVTTELVIYPREPHGPHEGKHQVDILRRVAGWFDRFLGSPDPAQLPELKT